MFFPVHNLGIGLLGGLRAEGWVSNKHFKHDDAERPPITRLVVAGLEKDFWRNIVWGAHCRVGEGSPRSLPTFCPVQIIEILDKFSEAELPLSSTHCSAVVVTIRPHQIPAEHGVK